MSHPRPVLGTSRTIVRLPTDQDIPEILTYYEDNRQHLEPHDPLWPPGFCTEEFWQRKILQCYDEFDRRIGVRFFIFDRGLPHLVLGTASLSQIFRGQFQACYLGYALDYRRQGQGLMREALQSAIAYMFDAQRLHRIMANYMPINERSGRLLRGLGFQVEGYARDYLYVGGAWRDHVLTALTNPDPDFSPAAPAAPRR